MKSRAMRLITGILTVALAAGVAGCGSTDAGSASGSASGSKVLELTNVSYDPTRELYANYNEIFKAYWKDKTGDDIEITQSHGGSGKQALEVANGLEADVVTLALEADVDAVKNAGLIEDGYTSEFDNDSAPYTSSIVFLVRSGNPKNIMDWDDLVRDDVGVIAPNPKTSGAARWNYLAAWYYFEQQGQSEDEVKASVGKFFENVVVLDSGARGSTTSFVENKQGDVMVSWENEAFLSLKQYPGEYEIVIPSTSIYCQPTVAIVDEVVDKRGSRELAKEYLQYLYSDDAQHLVAENYYRPYNKDILNEYVFNTDSRVIKEIPEDGKWIIPDVDMVTIDAFGGWTAATEKHFVDGGVFDQIYEEK
ncbi:MAG: sulfate ABC transporter substrate-binding protein [Lachnospiraceae bacterium]|nr:sulfate ABC transporter substrate-binding protein [Lachnospiraceae bacterium]